MTVPSLFTRRLSAALTMALLLALVPALLVLRAAPPAQALDNGLARTPPMGWNDWNAFGCNVTEQLVEQTADYLVSSGLKGAGYQYVNIDDCWMTSARNSAGQLVPDPVKFPNGISGTAAYVHSRGLKLGIYESAGTATCAGYPGSLGHEQTDADSFAAWGVDYLKYDNCNHQNVPDQQRYTAMRDALANTGRPIVYSLCNWGLASVWTWGAGVGNSWRTTDDINVNFSTVTSIYKANVKLAAYAKPGAWNDPDMLEVGNGMSFTEDRSHFSLWSEMAAPLIASAPTCARPPPRPSRSTATRKSSPSTRTPWASRAPRSPTPVACTSSPSPSPTATSRWSSSTRTPPPPPSPPPRRRPDSPPPPRTSSTTSGRTSSAAPAAPSRRASPATARSCTGSPSAAAPASAAPAR